MDYYSLYFAKYSLFLTVYEIRFCHKPVSYLMSWSVEIIEIKIFVSVYFHDIQREGGEGGGLRESERESARAHARENESC
jgi:hypothetical protein